MSEPITSTKTSQFIQRGSGKEVQYIGSCYDLDSIPTSLVGHDPIICKRDGKLAVVGKSQTAPELISFTIEGLLYATASYLDQLAERGCKFNYIEEQGCDTPGVFSDNPMTGSFVYDAEITGGEKGSIDQREADDPITLSREVDALPPRIDVWKMYSSQITTTEVNDANTIAALPGNCNGNCGEQVEVCEILVIGCDAVGAGTANVLISYDYGQTWAATAADPFAADENIMAIGAFRLDADTYRIFAVRDGDVADNLEGAYSDDYGATWTMVNIGTTNNEAAVGHQSLFIYNAANMWVCTDDGNVFKSTDAGVTWVLEASALVASGGNPLNAIRFMDQNIGVAVGDTDTVIYTVDGGRNWQAGTATGGGGDLDTVTVHSRYRFSVGTDDGDHYMSYDGAVTWNQLNNFEAAGTGGLRGMEFYNDMLGYMIHVVAGGEGYILRTISGGYSWERIGAAYGTNGLNAIHICSPNHLFSVGDDDGAIAVILEAGVQNA